MDPDNRRAPVIGKIKVVHVARRDIGRSPQSADTRAFPAEAASSAEILHVASQVHNNRCQPSSEIRIGSGGILIGLPRNLS
jgi:hypothetical protein